MSRCHARRFETLWATPPKTDTVVFALREVVRRGRLDELKSMMGRVRFEFDPSELRKKDRARV